MLNYLLRPISLESFVNEYWDKKPLYIERKTPTYYDQIITIDQVDQYLAQNDIRFPSIRMVKKGNEIRLSDYSELISIGKYASEGLIDVDRLYSQYYNGTSFFLQMMRSSIPSLASFVLALERDFKFRVETHLLLTPRASQGLAAHYDTTSSFIMQISGSKTWIVYEPELALPTIDQTFNNATFKGTKKIFEVTLLAGDMIYLPRGFIHEAKTSNEMSLHMTTVLYPYTWLDLLMSHLFYLTDNREFRKSTKAGVGYTDLGIFEALKQKAIESADYKNLFNREVQLAQARQVKNNTDRVNDCVQLSKITVKSVVGRRDNLFYNIEKTEKLCSLIFYGKKIDLPSFTGEALAFVVGEHRFSIENIPGKIDDNGKIVLVRKLIKEGFLKIFEL